MAEEKPEIIHNVRYIYYIGLLLVGITGLYELIVLARDKKAEAKK